MRHRRKGRVLGRSPSHQRAMLRNLASSLVLTEREFEPGEPGAPKVAGRVVTTVAKAKEVRPLVEKCITIAKRGLLAEKAAEVFSAPADRDTAEWKKWRQGEQWQKWAQAMAPAVTSRRRVLQLLGDKQAIRILFSTIAPRFTDRPGGYTRILKLAMPRLGDAGPRAILEFVNEPVSTASVAPKLESVS